MCHRYLIRYSYIGTDFRASTKPYITGGKTLMDPTSVQGSLEIAFHRLRPLKYPQIVQSSRTDGGVHALNAAAHIDLHLRGPLENTEICHILNVWFKSTSVAIKILNVQRVRPDFSSRTYALSRTYLYRIAFPKADVDPYDCFGAIPIEELNRCYFSKFKIDIDKVKEAAKLFRGYHDFETFKHAQSPEFWTHSRRNLYSVEIQKGRPMVTSASQDPEKLFDFWEVKIKGLSFVHKQIRRIVGTLEAAGRGKVTCEDIKLMLDIPSRNSWSSKIYTSPPTGLYFCDIEYNPQDLVYEEEDEDRNKNTIKSKRSYIQLLKRGAVAS